MNRIIKFLLIVLLTMCILTLVVYFTAWLSDRTFDPWAYFTMLGYCVDMLKEQAHIMQFTGVFTIFILIGLPIFFAWSALSKENN